MKKVSTIKEKIVEIAQSLMGKEGYSGVSMTDIAKGVGVTKASLYYFFKNKESIYLAVLKEIIREVSDQYTLKPKEKASKQLLTKKIEQSLQYGIHHGIIIATPEITDFKKNQKELVELDKEAKVMQDVMQVFLEKCGVKNPKFGTQILIDITHAYVRRTLFKTNKNTPKKLAADLANILIR